ncbi:hypothetical protein [Pantoea rodasii]|uniref:hypothetical protein n=1 Tax=Pantoea rodasii TaxID=1076549 RepID=UPI0012FD08AC|nr:hypothetical protein [Pantoea rodasii]
MGPKQSVKGVELICSHGTLQIQKSPQGCAVRAFRTLADDSGIAAKEFWWLAENATKS